LTLLASLTSLDAWFASWEWAMLIERSNCGCIGMCWISSFSDTICVCVGDVNCGKFAICKEFCYILVLNIEVSIVLLLLAVKCHCNLGNLTITLFHTHKPLH
jgi:hypothetical protein